VCIADLVNIKYFVNNTTEIKRIVFTYPDLVPSALVVELRRNCQLLWKLCENKLYMVNNKPSPLTLSTYVRMYVCMHIRLNYSL